MVWVLVRHRAPDYARFKKVFDEGIERVKASGCTAYCIMRDVNDPDVISVACTWRTEAEARAFFAGEEAEHADSPDEAGVVGEMEMLFVEVLEEMSFGAGRRWDDRGRESRQG